MPPTIDLTLTDSDDDFLPNSKRPKLGNSRDWGAGAFCDDEIQVVRPDQKQQLRDKATPSRLNASNAGSSLLDDCDDLVVAGERGNVSHHL